MKTKQTEEKLRIKLIVWVSELIVEWKMRPFSGKGSDRSDLIIKLAQKIDKFYSKTSDKQKEEIIKDIEQMPETFPEMESDEYDEGFGIAKRDIIKRIKKL